MIFRTAVRSDLPGILHAYRELNPDDPAVDPDVADKIWSGIEDSPWIRYFVAEDEGRVVAACNVAVVPNLTRGGRSWAVVENVVTLESARRRGAGRGAMRLAIEFAQSEGCYKICLLSNRTRIEAHRFYESLGFSGTAKVGFHMKLSEGSESP